MTSKNPLPKNNQTWMKSGKDDVGIPADVFLVYMTKLDIAISAIQKFAGALPAGITLIEATNNATAAAAGVPVGAFYKTTVVGPPDVVTVKLRTA